MSVAQDKTAVCRDLAAHPLFRGLGKTTVAQLVDRGTLVFLEPGEELYRSGAPATHVFALVRGALQIEYPRPQEVRGVVAAMLAAPCFLGECQVVHDRHWSGTGIALLPVTAVGINKDTLEELILESPEFALVVYRELTLRFLTAIESWKQKPDLTPPQNLARYVVGYLKISGGDHVPLRQAQLGRATGIRRETVNRILGAWEGENRLKTGPKGLTEVRSELLQELLGGREELTQSLGDALTPGIDLASQADESE